MIEDIKAALDVLQKGGVILYPTDTIWGIGCDACNEDAVKRVYAIKNRIDSKSMKWFSCHESKNVFRKKSKNTISN